MQFQIHLFEKHHQRHRHQQPVKQPNCVCACVSFEMVQHRQSTKNLNASKPTRKHRKGYAVKNCSVLCFFFALLSGYLTVTWLRQCLYKNSKPKKRTDLHVQPLLLVSCHPKAPEKQAMQSLRCRIHTTPP